MIHLLTKWLLAALAVMLAAYLVPGIMVASFYTALIVAVLLAVVNVIIKPILILLTLPLTILTLGLFTFVINALLFWFVGSVVKGFSVDGFIAAFLGALLVSIVSFIGNKILANND